MRRSKIYFDPEDYELLRLAKHVTESHVPDQKGLFLDNSLHPHGIIELAVSHELRIAHSVITLLDSLNAGEAQDRLQALRRLRDEVIHSAQSSLRYNTGRVLIQLMKEIVRSSGDINLQLALAHDFRKVVHGAPRMVRAMLKRYHLLEMPEQWNQMAFDHHVHDSSTKGRKTPTHLVMDAWVKGIRFLTVIYDHYIDAEAANELLRAAAVMEMNVRVGVRCSTVFHGSFIHFIWSPLNCHRNTFSNLLSDPALTSLQTNGKIAAVWVRKHILSLLEAWNLKHAPALAAELGLSSVPLADRDGFTAFVGRGQASELHLAEYIHKTALPYLRDKAMSLRKGLLLPEEKSNWPALQEQIKKLENLVPDIIAEKWLSKSANPDIIFPDAPHPGMPESMKRDTEDMLDYLAGLPAGQIVLSLADLRPEDVLELLWLGKGRISHIELFNLREWQTGHNQHAQRISELQYAINNGSAPRLKQVIRQIIKDYDEYAGENASPGRKKIFGRILANIPALQNYYFINPLDTRIGTASTSRSHHTHGMGLVFLETLPKAARKYLRSTKDDRRLRLPITTDIYSQTSYREDPQPRFGRRLTSLARALPGLGNFGRRVVKDWQIEKNTTRFCENGSLITLGGVNPEGLNNDFDAVINTAGLKPARPGFAYLNTNIVNALKVTAGFIPAQWSFMHDDNWWVLTWFGALIWFFITGFRNIIQAVVSGGGLGGSVMLRWNDYVSWSRMADSLLYTGISVPLLEVVVRQWLLEDIMGLTVIGHSFLVYTIIAMVNSIYVSGHNIYRGFPKEAIVGNLFRSALGIPLSVVYGKILYAVLLYAGLPEPLLLMQNCAAIVSKCASDTIAAMIEAFADRNQYMRLRGWDYNTKFAQIFHSHARQELLYPNLDMEELFNSPARLLKLLATENPRAAREAVANTLDMMYFWYYQPRARQIFLNKFKKMSDSERNVIIKMQNILTLEREISHMLLDGLLGRQFPKALSFYLSCHTAYLRDLHRKTRKLNRRPICPGRC